MIFELQKVLAVYYTCNTSEECVCICGLYFVYVLHILGEVWIHDCIVDTLHCYYC